MSRWVERLEKTLAASPASVTEVEGGRSVPYPQLLAGARRWAGLFSDLDRKFISVVLPNGIDYLEANLGALFSRNTFNPIPYFVSPGELRKILGYVKPGVLVTDRQDLVAEFGKEFRIVSPADAAKASPMAASRPAAEVDIYALYYSSGTTASPKGVLYSHGNVYSLISSIHKDFKFSEKTRQLALLPFGHTASINYNILPAFYAGSPLFVSQGFEKLRANFFEALKKHEINYVEIVPSVLLMLVNLKHKRVDLPHLEFVGCGSSTLPLDSQKRFMELYGVKVGNLYGLSETGPSHLDDPREKGWEPGSIGRPLSVNQCKVSPDGEILLKGPNVFVNYYQNETLYKEVVQDGWFHSGDLGFEKDGRYFFADRKKDLIIKSGINVVPAEIEEVIYQSGIVLECAVVAKPDRVHGETIAAALVPKDGVDAATFVPKVMEYCKANLSTYKVPSFTKVLDKIPKTHSGKLLRKKVRELFAE
jgi:long-chain acyl-CoA synthetase